jgi:hypothetical protein
MTHTFTSLRHPLEKLLEAEYFLARMRRAGGLSFQFELNAFLAACRSVTLLLQKSFAEVPGFARWYEDRQTEMRADRAMKFFLELRNLSQHAGPVSYVGGACLDGGWTYRFVHASERVPETLQGRDIVACSAEHLQKTARIIAVCSAAFPYSACPARAFSPEGMAQLGYEMVDAERAIGLPPGYSDVPGFEAEVKLRYLRRELEPLDQDTLDRMASGTFMDGEEAMTFRVSLGRDLVDDVADLIDPRDPGGTDMRTIFLRAVGARIQRQTSGDD